MAQGQAGDAYPACMSRTAFIVAWVAATALATVLAFGAVSFVTGDLRPGPQVIGVSAASTSASATTTPVAVAGEPPIVPSTSTTEPVDESSTSTDELPPATNVPRATTTTSVPTSTTVAAGETTDTRVISSLGGSAGVSCRGSSISLDWYAPAEGFSPEVELDGPEQVDLHFEDDGNWTSEIHAECRDGKVAPDVEEHQEED